MNFRQRLLRYMIGVFIGVLMVYFMFPDRDWLSWSPGNQIMGRLRSGKVEISEKGFCRMQCAQLDTAAFRQARIHGNIDFSHSDAQSNPKRYHLQHGDAYYEVLSTDSLFTVIDAGKANARLNCPCENLQ